ncbi:anti-sigma-28 factor FlgM [Thermosporothrix hazakensis]|jgi:anti-sigma28 factor (negative regulator of flagellin synthesis)|uniref:Anti-sigma-28 factor FlgM n=2 Tax=Thermosporothrix TaxID=768650 RepID=A0A326UG39_THEHA|nr:flagellar biosynthesis anti-sigma factor FlgM [Thermosporothrix hazakensis]PZW36741.1 anti-sigma-28 factor FlgM [Thermosporothrix hazakensis]BBH89209.1 hypothetical protein KTC_39600 [Thermosporothrix sp. COM3]GCE47391.1 hypothetical protein KTH_22600 [Thermosporothrix hazakensis]
MKSNAARKPLFFEQAQHRERNKVQGQTFQPGNQMNYEPVPHSRWYYDLPTVESLIAWEQDRAILVDKLRAQIEAGTYTVESTVVANCILKNETCFR